MNFFKIFSSNTPKEVEGYENLQNRINIKSNYLESAYRCFSNLNNSLKDFLKQIIYYNTKFTTIIKSSEEQPIHETCKLVYQKLINDLEQNSNLIDEYILNLNDLLQKFNQEKKIYEKLKIYNRDLEEEKTNLIKNKELYHKYGRDAEKNIKSFVQKNSQNLTNLSQEQKHELNNIISNSKKSLDNYTTSVNKVNDLVIKYNNTQNIIFNMLPELGNEDGVFFFRLVKLYFQCLENCEKYLNLNKNGNE